MLTQILWQVRVIAAVRITFLLFRRYRVDRCERGSQRRSDPYGGIEKRRGRYRREDAKRALAQTERSAGSGGRRIQHVRCRRTRRAASLSRTFLFRRFSLAEVLNHVAVIARRDLQQTVVHLSTNVTAV